MLGNELVQFIFFVGQRRKLFLGGIFPSGQFEFPRGEQVFFFSEDLLAITMLSFTLPLPLFQHTLRLFRLFLSSHTCSKYDFFGFGLR